MHFSLAVLTTNVPVTTGVIVLGKAQRIFSGERSGREGGIEKFPGKG